MQEKLCQHQPNANGCVNRVRKSDVVISMSSPVGVPGEVESGVECDEQLRLELTDLCRHPHPCAVGVLELTIWYSQQHCICFEYLSTAVKSTQIAAYIQAGASRCSTPPAQAAI